MLILMFWCVCVSVYVCGYRVVRDGQCVADVRHIGHLGHTTAGCVNAASDAWTTTVPGELHTHTHTCVLVQYFF